MQIDLKKLMYGKIIQRNQKNHSLKVLSLVTIEDSSFDTDIELIL